MDGLEAEAYDRSYSDRALIARIIGYFRPKLPIMIVVAVLIVLNSLLDTAFPILISKSIDTLVVSKTLSSAGMLFSIILVTGVFSPPRTFFPHPTPPPPSRAAL